MTQEEVIAVFDTPEVGALIDDLGLVQVGQPFKGKIVTCRVQKWLHNRLWPFPVWVSNRHQRFCDLYKRFLDNNAKFSGIMCRELYKRNKRFSRYVHASYNVD